MDQLEIAADQLSQSFDQKAKNFAENAGKDASGAPGKGGAMPDADAGRPAKPTEPGYDYKFDASSNQWLRRKKQ